MRIVKGTTTTPVGIDPYKLGKNPMSNCDHVFHKDKESTTLGTLYGPNQCIWAIYAGSDKYFGTSQPKIMIENGSSAWDSHVDDNN